MSRILLQWTLRLLLIILCGGYINAQNQSGIYGPNNCLISRLDVVPCQNLYPNLTPDPGINEYSIYRTAFGPGPVGVPICYLVGPSEDTWSSGIANISSIGREGEVKFLYSPRHPDQYGNQELATYNVQCPVRKRAFFYTIFADMEPPNCLNRCVDYVSIDQSPFGTAEFCGNSDEVFNIELNSFTVQFRSSPSVHHHGFRAIVVCYQRIDSFETSMGSMVNLLQTLSAEQLLIDTGVHRPGNYSDSLLLSAISFEHDNNPISSSVTRAILESASHEDVDRLRISLFSYSVVITHSALDTPTAGEIYALNCSLTGTADTVIYQWFHSNGTQLTNVSQLQFSPLLASHAGLYTCQATVGSVIVEGNTYMNISLPAPTAVTVTLPMDVITAGSFPTLTCTVELSTAVDIEVTVSTQWNSPDMTTVTPTSSMMKSLTRYTIMANVNPARDGNYTCQASIDSPSQLITGSGLTSGSTTVTFAPVGPGDKTSMTTPPPAAPAGSSSNNMVAIIGGVVAMIVVTIVIAVMTLIAIALLRRKKAEFSLNQKSVPCEAAGTVIPTPTDKEGEVYETIEAETEYEILDKYSQTYEDIKIPSPKPKLEAEAMQLQPMPSTGDYEFNQCPAYIPVATTSIHAWQ